MDWVRDWNYFLIFTLSRNFSEQIFFLNCDTPLTMCVLYNSKKSESVPIPPYMDSKKKIGVARCNRQRLELKFHLLQKNNFFLYFYSWIVYDYFFLFFFHFPCFDAFFFFSLWRNLFELLFLFFPLLSLKKLIVIRSLIEIRSENDYNLNWITVAEYSCHSTKLT